MRHSLSIYERWYGRDEPPPEAIALRAGDLTVDFQAGDLRCLRMGDQELVRRIYVAVRDPNWKTIPGFISDLAVETGDSSFRITYRCHHQAGPVDFRWQAQLEGTADGVIECALDGTAGSDFRYNRIGFCLLHPIQGIAGRHYQALTPGGPVSGRLPERIGPQRIVDGFQAPLFPSYTSLSIDLADGTRLVSDFAGDLFEMEDQRNWSDGSFKTYSTPLSLGNPHQARVGQAFFQKMTIRLEGLALVERRPARAPGAPIRLALGDETGLRLPQLGFGIPAGKDAPDERERLLLDLLARLRPDHLKTELHLGDSGWPDHLQRAARVAGRVGSPLELALFLDDTPEESLRRVAHELEGVRLARVIVFHEAEAGRGATSPRWMELARQALADARPGLPFLGGTNGNFAQLNCRPFETTLMDGVSYPLNPQVHAFDERSLIEGIEAQREMVNSARVLANGLPVVVSSVTLKPPFNQVAREAEGPGDHNRLPASVDPRQMALFAAAWTTGSLRSLAAGGASSVTYYEMSGWRGLVETGQGCRLPAQFRSFPGMIFPVYWVFRFLADAKGGALLDTHSERPLDADVLALRGPDRLWLAVVNYLPREQEVRLSPLPPGQVTRLCLNEDTFAEAVTDPGAFLAGMEGIEPVNGELGLRLKPYETSLVVARLAE